MNEHEEKIITAHPQPYYTPEEYLTLERGAEFKSEYRNGLIYAMAGSSPEHSAIAANVTIALGAQMGQKPCQFFNNDLKVATSSTGLFAYPDLTVVCGEPRFHDEHRDVLTNATGIVEVLSPSTEAYDRGRKFTQYQQMNSLTHYILVSQDEPRIEQYIREGENDWHLTVAGGLDASLFVASPGCTLRLSQVYRNVRFPELPAS